MVIQPLVAEDINAFLFWMADYLTSKLQDLSVSEQLLFKEHILLSWDIGAKRTVYCYFEEETTSTIIHFLNSYFKKYFHKELRHWTVHNPSAAAVALCRLYRF